MALLQGRKTGSFKMSDSSNSGIPRGLDGKPVEVPHRSAFVEAYEKRERWTMTVDMASVLGHCVESHDGSQLTRVCYRVNTKSEDDEALVAAYAHVSRLSRLAEGGKDEFLRAGDTGNDNKAIEALYRCCRNPDDPSRTLFPTPLWMRDNFDTDIIAGLLNGYNEARARKSGVPWDIEDVSLEATREMLVAAAETELPGALLAPFTREYLTQLLTLLAVRWHEDRQHAADLLTEGLLNRPGDDTWAKAARSLVAEWGAEPADQEGDEG